MVAPPATAVATSPATGIETASPCSPDTASPTRWVNKMYAPQHPAAPRAKPTPTASTAPCQGSVSSSTPTAASAGKASIRRLVLRMVATPRGPRNSSALAMPSGSRATEAMNSRVTPAVTTPSATQARRLARPSAASRGRTRTGSRTPAQHSRSHAAPSGPTSSNSPTEAARPICTHSIEVIAIAVPARAVPRADDNPAAPPSPVVPLSVEEAGEVTR